MDGMLANSGLEARNFKNARRSVMVSSSSNQGSDGIEEGIE